MIYDKRSGITISSLPEFAALMGRLRNIQIQLSSEARRTQTKGIKLMTMFIHFFCLCSLDVTINLNSEAHEV